MRDATICPDRLLFHHKSVPVPCTVCTIATTIIFFKKGILNSSLIADAADVLLIYLYVCVLFNLSENKLSKNIFQICLSGVQEVRFTVKL